MKNVEVLKYYGRMKHSVILGACDFGEGVTDAGVHIYTTWGKNLSFEECARFRNPVRTGEGPDYFYEVEVPAEVLEEFAQAGLIIRKEASHV